MSNSSVADPSHTNLINFEYDNNQKNFINKKYKVLLNGNEVEKKNLEDINESEFNKSLPNTFRNRRFVSRKKY